jgi:hypothetical protein
MVILEQLFEFSPVIRFGYVLTSGSTDEAASFMCHLIKQLMTFHFGGH